MKGYSYDRTTKEFTGEIDLELDPLETQKQGIEIYLLPAYATYNAPPNVQEHKVAVCDEILGVWNIIEDYRGLVFWLVDNPNMYKIEEIGIVPPEDAIFQPPENPVAEQEDPSYEIMIMQKARDIIERQAQKELKEAGKVPEDFDIIEYRSNAAHAQTVESKAQEILETKAQEELKADGAIPKDFDLLKHRA